MNRTFLKFGVAVLMVAMAGMTAGCKTGQKFEAPKIPSIQPENVHGVMAPDDNNIWIVGNYGIIYHSSDGGKNWVAQNSGMKTLLCDGVFVDAKTGWVIGINGTILHTSDGGNTWVKQDSGTQKHLFGIAFTDKDYGWAVGEYSTIIHTTDGGATWKPQQPEADKIYNNVCFTDRQNGWIVGEAGSMVHTTDGGTTWTQVVPKVFERNGLEDEYERPRPSLFCI
ncbi:MAG: YCF48-related protein, partial [Proteobacteria bacterium]|nr:YCF48-related protein [Pseudomonadota bacterium]